MSKQKGAEGDSSKKKVIEQCFKNFLKCFQPISALKNTIKKINHRACLRDMMDQTYLIYTCTGTNHTSYNPLTPRSNLYFSLLSTIQFL